jgi:hypothetical protein
MFTFPFGPDPSWFDTYWYTPHPERCRPPHRRTVLVLTLVIGGIMAGAGLLSGLAPHG